MSDEPLRILCDVDGCSTDKGASESDASPKTLGASNPLSRGAKTRINMPVAIQPFRRLPATERRARALPVLRQTLQMIRADGWCQGAMRDDKGRWSVYGAIAEAGEAMMPSEYAREVLRELLWTHDVVAWNNRPERERREVIRILERAIRLCSTKRPGGWSVTMGERPAKGSP